MQLMNTLSSCSSRFSILFLLNTLFVSCLTLGLLRKLFFPFHSCISFFRRNILHQQNYWTSNLILFLFFVTLSTRSCTPQVKSQVDHLVFIILTLYRLKFSTHFTQLTTASSWLLQQDQERQSVQSLPS